MDLNYILNSPLDQNTTEEANAQQTNEILDLLYKTVQPKLAGRGKTVYKIKDDKIQLQTEADKINIQINKREMDFLSVEDIIELNKEAQSLFEEEGIYGVAGLKDRGIHFLVWIEIPCQIFLYKKEDICCPLVIQSIHHKNHERRLNKCPIMILS